LQGNPISFKMAIALRLVSPAGAFYIPKAFFVHTFQADINRF